MSRPIHFIGCQVAETLVHTFGVVELKVIRQPYGKFPECAIAAQIDILVLHRTPQPLDEDVIKCPASTIHADLDLMSLEHPRERFAGELRALVTVEHLGRSVQLQSIFQCIHAEGTKIGVINRHGVLCCATLIMGRWWYSLATIEEIGRWDSYQKEREDLERALRETAPTYKAAAQPAEGVGA